MIIEKRNHIRKAVPARVDPFSEFYLSIQGNWGRGPVKGNVRIPWLVAMLSALLVGVAAYTATCLTFLWANSSGPARLVGIMDGVSHFCHGWVMGVLT